MCRSLSLYQFLDTVNLKVVLYDWVFHCSEVCGQHKLEAWVYCLVSRILCGKNVTQH